mmetsp:Transcript_116231/g.323711  ORF Transcript_116231/g.323711 Transcript_116231/m.323711 type:complete len:104 (+) Transcript_116231:841-1152(+)
MLAQVQLQLQVPRELTGHWVKAPLACPLGSNTTSMAPAELPLCGVAATWPTGCADLSTRELTVTSPTRKVEVRAIRRAQARRILHLADQVAPRASIGLAHTAS